MKVRMRNPDRELVVAGDRTVASVLTELAVAPDTVLVIRAGELVTREDQVSELDELEIRPVISGGSRP